MLIRPARRAIIPVLAAGVLTGVPAVAAAAPSPASTPAATSRTATAMPAWTRTLRPRIWRNLQQHRVPGAIVLIRTPRTGVWKATLGTADLTTGRAMHVRDRVRIGSITKTMTGIVILQLVREGKIGLDDPVSKYRAGVPNGGQVTIRQLLGMRSGLPTYSTDRAFNQSLDDRPERVWRVSELLRIAFAQPAEKPGAAYHYSNTNTVLLGLVIQEITGRPLREELRRRIFEPLGMRATRLPRAADTGFGGRHAHGYQSIGNVENLTAPVLHGDAGAVVNWNAPPPDDVTYANPSWTWAAGGVTSNAGDLLRYARALGTGRLVGPRLFREQTRLTPVVPGVGYGLAMVDILGFRGHTGSIPGYNSFIGYHPGLRATVVVLVNLNQAPDGTAPADELTRLIISEVFPQVLPS